MVASKLHAKNDWYPPMPLTVVMSRCAASVITWTPSKYMALVHVPIAGTRPSLVSEYPTSMPYTTVPSSASYRSSSLSLRHAVSPHG